MPLKCLDQVSSTPVLILAAGASRRLGRPKQTEMLGHETLIGRAVRVAVEAELGPVYVVLRAGDTSTLAVVGQFECSVLFNLESAEGIASSIRAGVRRIAGESHAVLIMTCDQPAVTAKHLRSLSEHEGEAVMASSYDGRCGVPAWFSAATFPALLALRGDQGARDLLQGAKTRDLPNGELDIDTWQDLERARTLLSNGS